jgi:hypothetical protein
LNGEFRTVGIASIGVLFLFSFLSNISLLFHAMSRLWINGQSSLLTVFVEDDDWYALVGKDRDAHSEMSMRPRINSTDEGSEAQSTRSSFPLHSGSGSEGLYQTDEDSDYESSNGSPPPVFRNVSEEEYMKIAVTRRIRRVRGTIYEDPGNPFLTNEWDDEDLVLTGLNDHAQEVLPMTARNINSAPISWSPASENWTRCENREHANTEGVRRGASLLAPTPRRPGTFQLGRAQTVREHSNPLTMNPPTPEPKGKDPTPIKERWRKSLPLATEPRDTAFYDFYDGVLDGYDGKNRR